MSGSDAKRKRKEQRAEGNDKWQVKEQEELQKKKKSKKIFWIALPIVIVVAAFIILMNSSWPYTGLTAVEVGGDKYTAADFNYYYYTVYGNFKNSYSELFDKMIDEDLSLDKQMFDDEQSWAEYFTSMALATMKETTALCKAAEEAGYTLSQEGQDDIDAQITEMSMYYPYYGFKNADQYFSYIYGKGMTAEVFRKNVERVVLSTEYSEYVQNNAEFTDDEVLSEYDANQNNYDKAIYRYYYVSAASEGEEDMAAAKKAADEFAAYADTEEKFMARALELAGDDVKADYEWSSGTMRRYSIASLTSNYSDWLTDSSRQFGDVTVVESYTGYGVLFYIGYDDAHYNTRDVRHILVQVGEDAEGEAEGTAHTEAMTKAEGYLQEFKDNGATEDAFGELAKTYSYDTNTYENGGLCEKIYKSQYTTEFENWVFDDARQYGDVEIVEASDGIHIMFYVGENEPYWSMAARQALQTGYFNEWKTALVETYDATEKFGMKFAAN